MQTLLDLFDRIDGLGDREALSLYNGYHTRKTTYAELAAGARAFAAHLDGQGVGRGDCVLLWAENCPEWAAAFWGCVLRGAAVVPLDARSNPDFAARIAARAKVKLAVVGRELSRQFEAPVVPLDSITELSAAPDLTPAGVGPDDIAEIVFTSGSTSEPKGVLHRHRNICSNLTAVAREIERHRKWAAPFQPIRFLELLPLSHLFGQTMGLYIPPLLGGAAAFSTQLSAPAILDALRGNRVSVLVAVPQMAAQLRDELERRSKRAPRPLRLRGIASVLESWWRHRDLHRLTGWKFWALVVGGASLDESLEEFYRRVGFAVIQGYGLTEASPVVAVNHPFSTRKGSIGKPLPGQEIRLADDGEILVRGASVTSEMLGASAPSEKIRDGWLHTGDIGEMDADGRLYFRGRKSDMIVRPDGMNVFPTDVEAALAREPDITESAVVGVGGRVHAALVLRDGSRDARAVVASANAALEAHQRIQDWSVWRKDELPRTSSTWKIRRGELAAQLEGRREGEQPEAAVESLLGEAVEVSDLEADLGLSSLERVDLLARVEERVGREVGDDEFARVRTVGQLRSLVEGGAAQAPPSKPPGRLLEPAWNRSWAVRQVRALLQDFAMFPLSAQLIEVETMGVDNLRDLEPPVLFIANHVSHFDTLVLLRALPKPWRRRVAPAMSQDYFAALFNPSAALGDRLADLGQYVAACGLFNAYPLPQALSGTRRALRYTGLLVDAGWCPLLYPEGTRSEDGRLLPFKPGVGLMAKELGLTVVPVHLQGLFEIYSVRHERPKPGKAIVRIGQALDLRAAESYEAAAAQAERAMRDLVAEGRTGTLDAVSDS